MILIPCPWCGPRDAGEFHYSGEASARPDPASATPLQWREYLYFPVNPRGQVTENWYHRAGCRQFFAIQRDTDTNDSQPAGGPR